MSERSAARLERAERAAQSARAQLGETLAGIQRKLSPTNILNEAGKELREKGLQMTDQIVASVRSRPVLATILASGIGWMLSRKPGLALVLKLFLGSGATSRASAHSIGSKPQRPRDRRERAASAVAPEETA